MRLVTKVPDVGKAIRVDRDRSRRLNRAAAIIATDRAIFGGREELGRQMRAAGLGNLYRAIGATSTKRKGGSGDPYGVWFARDSDESRGGGALEAYSRGATIRPGPGHSWLWVPTRAIQRRIKIGSGRYRVTPARWIGSSLEQTIGKLEFRQISASRAILVVKDVTLSPKTGLAKARGPGRTRTRIPVKEIIAFTGIRSTTRSQRVDKDAVALRWSRRVPEFMAEAHDNLARGPVRR